jgi:hypothetical protein
MLKITRAGGRRDGHTAATHKAATKENNVSLPDTSTLTLHTLFDRLHAAQDEHNADLAPAYRHASGGQRFFQVSRAEAAAELSSSL